MKKTKGIPKKNDNKNETVMHLAFELSQTKWKLVSSDGKKVRSKGIEARNLDQFQEEVVSQKEI